MAIFGPTAYLSRWFCVSKQVRLVWTFTIHLSKLYGLHIQYRIIILKVFINGLLEIIYNDLVHPNINRMEDTASNVFSTNNWDEFLITLTVAVYQVTYSVLQ